MNRKLRRDLRLLQAWVVVATVGLAVLGTSWLGEAQATRTRFTEIDVERINVVESDGGVRLVIANSARQPTPSSRDASSLPAAGGQPACSSSTRRAMRSAD